MRESAARRHPVTVDGESATIADAPELAVALELLRGGRGARALLDQLEPHLAGLIAGPDGLLLVVRALEPAGRSHLVALLGPRLADLVRGARHLAELLAITADQPTEECLLGALGADALRSLVVTPHHLAELLQWVYGECDHLLLDLLGAEHLRRLFTTAPELAHALHALDAHGREHLLLLLGPGLAAGLVRNAHDLGRLLRCLPRPAAQALLAGIPLADLVTRIGGEAEWRHLCRRLPDEEAGLLFERLGYRRHAS